jgi:hypothetical protein
MARPRRLKDLRVPSVSGADKHDAEVDNRAERRQDGQWVLLHQQQQISPSTPASRGTDERQRRSGQRPAVDQTAFGPEHEHKADRIFMVASLSRSICVLATTAA